MAPLTPSHSVCSLDALFDPLSDDDFELFLSPPPTKRKRVRINNTVQVLDYVEHSTDLTKADRLRGWWSKAEYEGTKSAAKASCRELRRRGTFRGCLTDAYTLACKAADNTKSTESNFDSNIASLSLAPQSSLVRWCSGAETSRGLERWSSKVHGFLRGKHVGEAKHAVLLEQARQFLLNERNDEALARVSTEASKRSRAFARLLGAADAVVADEGAVSGCRKVFDNCDDENPRSRKVRKVTPDSSPNDPILLSDEDSSDEEMKSPIYIDFDFP